LSLILIFLVVVGFCLSVGTCLERTNAAFRMSINEDSERISYNKDT